MPPELIEDCRFLANRRDLVAALPKGGRVLEIGTAHGTFARHILDAAAPTELHLIDVLISSVRADVASDSRVTLHHGKSLERLSALPADYFDWIYIDADHSYRATAADAALSAAKVKPGGYLVFNDFAHLDPNLGSYGVHRAVMEFLVERRWQVVFFAFNQDALYDIAIQRPGEAIGTT